MRAVLYLLLVAGLVPVQTTLVPHVSVLDVRPDLCLVAVCLIGFLAGETEGLLMGLALGLVQDLFSAGGGWLNLTSKGSIGLLAALLWRQVAHPTTYAILLSILGLSFCSGLVFLLTLRMGPGLTDPLFALSRVVLPQALFDAAVGAGLYWLLKGGTRGRLTADEDALRFGA